jgi:hypothetical protein
MRKTLVCLTLVPAAVVALTSAALADVTIKRNTAMDGMGGLLKSTTTSTESYSGDMMSNDGETKMENKLMKMFGGGKPIRSTSITRLDKGLMWNVDHKKKEYTEMTFAEMKAMMDSLGTMMAGGADPMAQQQPTIDTAEWEFSEPKFDVKQTGKQETIAGHNCDQTIMTMISTGTNRKTGETMTMEVTMDMMLAQNVPGAEEITEFGKRMAAAMGFEMDKGGAQSMAKFVEMYGIDPERLAEESEKLEGFAMKTVMTFGMGGDAMEKAQAEAEAAEAEQAKAEEEEEAKKDEEEPTDASGMAAKALGGLFGKKDKKQDDDKDAKTDAAAAPSGALMWMTTTVTGIESGTVAPATFEIPEGYKLKSE